MILSKFIRITPIDLLLYRYDLNKIASSVSVDVSIEILKRTHRRTITYTAILNEEEVHYSQVFLNLLLLRQFGYKKQPVIGNCVTKQVYRGLRIYPYVLRHIIFDLHKQGHKYVYIFVALNNYASIHGIERVGFKQIAHLHGKRIGPILFNRSQSLPGV